MKHLKLFIGLLIFSRLAYSWVGDHALLQPTRPSQPVITERHQENIDVKTNFEAYGDGTAELSQEQVMYPTHSIKVTMNENGEMAGFILTLDSPVQLSSGDSVGAWFYITSQLSNVIRQRQSRFCAVWKFYNEENEETMLRKEVCWNAPANEWYPAIYTLGKDFVLAKMVFYVELKFLAPEPIPFYVDKICCFTIRQDETTGEIQRILYLPGGFYGSVFNDDQGVWYYEIYIADPLGRGRRLFHRVEDWNSHEVINLIRGELFDLRNMGYNENLSLILKAVSLNAEEYEEKHVYRTQRRPELMNSN